MNTIKSVYNELKINVYLAVDLQLSMLNNTSTPTKFIKSVRTLIFSKQTHSVANVKVGLL